MGCGDSRAAIPSGPAPLKLPLNEEDYEDDILIREKFEPQENDTQNGEDAEELETGDFDFITEYSSPELIKIVTDSFTPRDWQDLIIIGKACPRLLSGVQKSKLEEQKILETLRNEGLIARPLKASQNATGFEIIEKESEFKLAPMPTLDRERSASKRLTSEAIKEKLAKAEERRKQQEDEKKARAATARPVRSTKTQERQEEERNLQIERWENGIRNREIHIMETKAKLREKHQRIKGLNFKKSYKDLVIDPFED